MVLATAGPLCLDPDPEIGRAAINNQHRRQIWNTSTLRRQMKKFSQVAINRKRKTDQFTHAHGLELHDFITRARHKQRMHAEAVGDANKLPKRPVDVIQQQRRAPVLEYPPLCAPSEIGVDKKAKSYDRPRETKDFMPQLIEEHVLETDRGGSRVYHIKLSIFQRPANSEYLGELYVDRDYKDGSSDAYMVGQTTAASSLQSLSATFAERDIKEIEPRNGKACQFSLGTRTHANRYIKQFTEIFTEEGRKPVKMTYIVNGREEVTYSGMSKNRILEQQQMQQQQQQLQQQQLQQHQQILASQPIMAPANVAASLNTTNINTLPGNQVMPNTSATIIEITNIQQQQQQQQFIQTSNQSQQLQHIYTTSDNSTIQQIQHSQQPTHLSITNGSLVVVQQQSGGNITGIQMATPQQHQQALTAINNVSTVRSNVPVLVRFLLPMSNIQIKKN